MADDIGFDWDEANTDHIARHGVTPEEAEQALLNEPFDQHYAVRNGEERWTIIGHTNNLRVLLVVWTLRGDAVRVVTAREASKKASTAYFQQKGVIG